MNKERMLKVLKLIIFIDVAIAILYFLFYGFPKSPIELLSKVGILTLTRDTGHKCTAGIFTAKKYNKSLERNI